VTDRRLAVTFDRVRAPVHAAPFARETAAIRELGRTGL